MNSSHQGVEPRRIVATTYEHDLSIAGLALKRTFCCRHSVQAFTREFRKCGGSRSIVGESKSDARYCLCDDIWSAEKRTLEKMRRRAVLYLLDLISCEFPLVDSGEILPTPALTTCGVAERHHFQPLNSPFLLTSSVLLLLQLLSRGKITVPRSNES